MGTIESKSIIYDKTKPNVVELRRLQIPEDVDPDELLIKTEYSGVCGSDIHTLKGWSPFNNVVPGHEVCGIVHRVGERFVDAERKPLQEGDRVVPEPTVPCYQCDYCMGKRGLFEGEIDYYTCENYILLGTVPIDRKPQKITGCWSEYVNISFGYKVHKINKTTPEEAVLLEPLAVGIRSVRKARVTKGTLVVAQGPGPIGLMVVVAAKERGAEPVILIGMDVDKQRLSIAKEIGADIVINRDKQEPYKEIMKISKGRGADVVIDTTGSVEAAMDGFKFTARAGTYVLIGGFKAETTIPIHPIYHLKEKIDILFSHGSSGCFKEGLAILESQKYPFKKMVSHVLQPERIGDLLAIFDKERETIGKILIKF